MLDFNFEIFALISLIWNFLGDFKDSYPIHAISYYICYN